jgi:hypothetical protein
MSSEVCYFCEHTARSDNLRKHCKSVHTADQVVEKLLANGLKFRRDTDRPSLLVSLKAEGSAENCGYCFDCHSKITVLRGAKNPLGAIQRHQCREVKPRTKKVAAAVGGAGVTTVTPISYVKLTEDDFKKRINAATGAFPNVISEGPMETLYDDDSNLILPNALNYFLEQVEKLYKAHQALKEAPATAAVSPSSTLNLVVSSHRSAKSIRSFVKEQKRRSYLADPEDYNSDDEALGIQHAALSALMDKAAVSTVSASEVSDRDKQIDELTVALTDKDIRLRTAESNAIGYYKELQTAQNRIRLLEAQLAAQAEKIEHLTASTE